MSITKDPLHIPALARLKPKPNKLVPSILKKRLQFNPVAHFSNESWKQVAPKAPVVPPALKLPVGSTNDVQVLVLDESDFSDIVTGNETFKIVGDVIPDVNNIEEIVVGKEQVFQLKPFQPGHTKFPIKVNRKGKKTTTVRIVNRRLQPNHNLKNATQPVQSKENVKHEPQTILNFNGQNFLNSDRIVQNHGENVKEKIPLIQNVVSGSVLSRNSALLVGNGIHVTEAVDISSETSRNDKNIVLSVKNVTDMKEPVKTVQNSKENGHRIENLRNANGKFVQNCQQPSQTVVKSTVQNHRENIKDKVSPVQNLPSASVQNNKQTIFSFKKAPSALLPVQNISDRFLQNCTGNIRHKVKSFRYVTHGTLKNLRQPIANSTDQIRKENFKDKIIPVRNVAGESIPNLKESVTSVKNGVDAIRLDDRSVQSCKRTLSPAEDSTHRITQSIINDFDENDENRNDTLPPMEDISIIDDSGDENVDGNQSSALEGAETPSSSQQTIEMSICRTCLKPVAPSACHRLYDTGKNNNTSLNLRQKLVKVAESINIQASLDPVVCTVCFETIQTAHSFLKRVNTIEEQIEKRRKGLAPVDLKVMLEEMEEERFGDARRRAKTCKSVQVNLAEYLDKRKRLIARYLVSLKDNEPPPKAKIAKTSSITTKTTNATKKPNQNVSSTLLSESDDSQLSLLALENLLGGSERSNVIEIINEDEGFETTLTFPESPTPIVESTVPDLEFSVPNQESAIQNIKSDEILELNIPNPDSAIQNTDPTVSNPESTISNIEFVSDQESTITNLELAAPNPDTDQIVDLTVPNQESTVQNIESTVSNLESTIPNVESTVTNAEPVEILGLSIPNPESTVPNVELPIPNVESPNPNPEPVEILGLTIPNLESTVSYVESTIPNLESTNPNPEPVEILGLTIPNPESTVPNVESIIPNLESTNPNLEPVEILGSAIPNPDSTIPNVESPIPNLESTLPNLEFTVPNLESLAPNPESVQILESTVPNLEDVQIRELTMPNPESNIENTESTVANLESTSVGFVPILELTDPNVKSNIPNTESIHILELTVPNPQSTIPNIESDPILQSTVPDIEFAIPNRHPPDSILEPAIPDIESVPDLEWTVPDVESSVATTESDIQLEYSIPESSDPISNSETDLLAMVGMSALEIMDVEDPVPVKKMAPIEQSEASSLDAFLAKRQEKFKILASPGQFLILGPQVVQKVQQEVAANVDVGTRDSSGDAYSNLSNTNCSKKKKPEIPKTFDLFDEEHDKYFENLEGEVGCFMVRKWNRLSRRQHDRGRTSFLCENCGKIYTDKTKFKNHVDDHKGLDLTICSYCGLQIKTRRLKHHVMVRHKPLRYECEECGKKFHLNSLLANHVSEMHQNVNRRCQCQVCGVMLMKNSLLVHMRRHNNKVFHCDICKKTFKNQVSWYTHRRRHLNPKIYTCNICSKPIRSLYNLNKHMKAFHEGGETRTCPICDKMLSKRESLIRHLRIKHRSEPRVVQRRNRKKTKLTSKVEEVKQVTDFVLNDDDQGKLSVLTETQEEVIYESIVEAPMDMEEIEIPYSTMDSMFC